SELKGQGGLIETVKLYLNRMKLKKDEIPQRAENPEQLQRLTTEHERLIKVTEAALTQLERMTQIFNEKVIALESQRPQLANDLAMKEYERVAVGIENLSKIIEDTNRSLDDILLKSRNVPTN